MDIPGIGQRIATKIMELRQIMGNISREVFCNIPYLRPTEAMFHEIDFTPRHQTCLDREFGGHFAQASPGYGNRKHFERDRYTGPEEQPRGSMSTNYMTQDTKEWPYSRYSQSEFLDNPTHRRQDTHEPTSSGIQPEGNGRLSRQRQSDTRPKSFANLPKTLKYTGTGDWKAFHTKFSRYAETMNWSAKECKNNLCWVLEDKASEFFTMLLERDESIEYFDIVSKLEKRFGYKELPETSRARLRNAKQYPSEKLAEWADRVLSLATKAYKDLPEYYMYQEAVMAICQGTSDKEAGQYVSNLKLSSIEEVVDNIRWYQHSRKAIYGASAKTDYATEEPNSEEEGPSCRKVWTQSGNKGFGTRIAKLEEDVKSLSFDIGSLKSKTLDIDSKTSKILNILSQRTRRTNDTVNDGKCFNCNEEGHIKANCPKLKDANAAVRNVEVGKEEDDSLTDDMQELNFERSGNEA